MKNKSFFVYYKDFNHPQLMSTKELANLFKELTPLRGKARTTDIWSSKHNHLVIPGMCTIVDGEFFKRELTLLYWICSGGFKPNGN